MPLSFNSDSHGPIAFGFFNIDADMLLLERYFFFADDWCNRIAELAELGPVADHQTSWSVYHIADRQNIGDLLGAIHGIRHVGFIGQTYLRFPFPADQKDFKQKPDGFKNRSIFQSLIAPFADQIDIPVKLDATRQQVTVGDYRFSKETFCALVSYVWVGGYPRWKDGIRPDYMKDFSKIIRKSQCWLLRDYELPI